MQNSYVKAERCFLCTYDGQEHQFKLELRMPCGVPNIPLMRGPDREVKALYGLLVMYFEKEFDRSYAAGRDKRLKK